MAKDKKNIKIDNEEETSTNGRKSERDYSGIHYDKPEKIETHNIDGPLIREVEAMSGSLDNQEVTNGSDLNQPDEDPCTAVTAKGTQCTRNAVNKVIPFCWQHARQRLERTLWGTNLDDSTDDLTPQEVVDIVLAALGDDDDSVLPPDVSIDNPLETYDPNEPCPTCGRGPEDDECPVCEENQDAPSDPIEIDDPIILDPIGPIGPIGPIVTDDGPNWLNPQTCPANISTYDLNHLRPDGAVGMYVIDPRWVADGGHNVVKFIGTEGYVTHWFPGELTETTPSNPLIEHFANNQNWPISSEAGSGDAMGSYIKKDDWIFVWDTQTEMWCGRPIKAFYSSQSGNMIQFSTITSFDKTYTQSAGNYVRILIFQK